MIRILTLSLGLITFLISCENNNTTEEMNANLENRKETKLIIEFTNVSHLVVGDKVRSNGLEIGRVSKIELSKNGQSVYVIVKFEDKQLIPKESEFYLTSIDILGTKGIDIIYSDAKEYYQNMDTVYGLQQEVDSTYLLNLKEMTKSILKSTDSLMKKGEINMDSLMNNILESFEMVKFKNNHYQK